MEAVTFSVMSTQRPGCSIPHVWPVVSDTSPSYRREYWGQRGLNSFSLLWPPHTWPHSSRVLQPAVAWVFWASVDPMGKAHGSALEHGTGSTDCLAFGKRPGGGVARCGKAWTKKIPALLGFLPQRGKHPLTIAFLSSVDWEYFSRIQDVAIGLICNGRTFYLF